MWFIFFFFKQKTAYEMRISDWSSDVCSSDLKFFRFPRGGGGMSEATFSLNGEERPWRDASLSELLAEAGVDGVRGGVAVARNGSVVPRTEWDETPVEPEDRIESVHIVRGG